MFLNRLRWVLVCFFVVTTPLYAGEKHYVLDRHEANWTAFHYTDEKQEISSCFALSNDLTLGFKKDSKAVGLMVWDQKGLQNPGSDRKMAITVGKEHFLFIMKAMDRNMLMNRLNIKDFKTLLSRLSYVDMAVVEYGQQPVSIVDMSGLPSVLSQFQHCMSKVGTKGS